MFLIFITFLLLLYTLKDSYYFVNPKETYKNYCNQLENLIFISEYFSKPLTIDFLKILKIYIRICRMLMIGIYIILIGYYTYIADMGKDVGHTLLFALSYVQIATCCININKLICHFHIYNITIDKRYRLFNFCLDYIYYFYVLCLLLSKVF